MHGEFVENEYYKKKDNPASEQKNPNKQCHCAKLGIYHIYNVKKTKQF